MGMMFQFSIVILKDVIESALLINQTQGNLLLDVVVWEALSHVNINHVISYSYRVVATILISHHLISVVMVAAYQILTYWCLLQVVLLIYLVHHIIVTCNYQGIIASSVPCNFHWTQKSSDCCFSRPLAASININPTYLNTLSKSTSNSTQVRIAVKAVLHEMTHSLGFAPFFYDSFVNQPAVLYERVSRKTPSSLQLFESNN